MKQKNTNTISRREFFGQASCAAVGSATLLSSILNLGAVNSLAGMNLDPSQKGDDYKALVCLLLDGGNDSFNMLVPNNGVHYAEYAKTRSNLALPQSELLGINYTDNNGKQFGLHPSMPEVQKLFNDKKLAFISNVGTLVQPTTKQQYLNESVKLPLGLMSHADQIQHWQTGLPQSRASKGWGGRLADILNAGNDNKNISMSISLSGTNIYQAGNKTDEYAIRSRAGGSVGIRVYDKKNPFDKMLLSGVQSILEKDYQDIYKSTYANKTKSSQANHEQFSAALKNSVKINTVFSENEVSQNMKLVAETIAARTDLKMKRQVFFVKYGGWDHHDNVLSNQVEMLKNVSKALSEFQTAMDELNLGEKVTAFTMSDFGRTLTSNGNGSDHAWGGNVMAVGGAVKGGQVYGQYPSLALNSDLDVGGAILLPTLSTDQYFGEISKWFGVPNSDLKYVLPNIANFYDPNSSDLPIGFLNL